MLAEFRLFVNFLPKIKVVVRLFAMAAHILNVPFWDDWLDSSFVQGFAKELSEEVKTLGIPTEVIDIKDYDPDDRLSDEVSSLQSSEGQKDISV